MQINSGTKIGRPKVASFFFINRYLMQLARAFWGTKIYVNQNDAIASS